MDDVRIVEAQAYLAWINGKAAKAAYLRANARSLGWAQAKLACGRNATLWFQEEVNSLLLEAKLLEASVARLPGEKEVWAAL